jgi:hypothetical protein
MNGTALIPERERERPIFLGYGAVSGNLIFVGF